MTVFIAGSRRVSSFGDDVTGRLDNIIAKNLKIIIGDANGVDKSVQDYLLSRSYQNVEIFCMDGICRNNIGSWPTRSIEAWNKSRRDLVYYSTKDKAMAQEANYGLMLWNGISRGTLRNIVDLLKRNIPVAVYLSGERSFHTLTQLEDLARIMGNSSVEALLKIA